MHILKPLLPVIMLVAFIPSLRTDTILVPSQQPTIQAGIDVAVDGDTVLVADGSYTGDGNRDIDFLGKAIVVRSENGPENCTIDCEGDSLNSHRGFVFQTAEDTTSILSGFTIQNGYAVGDELDASGGGILCEAASPRIVGNIVTKNYAFRDGAGIRCSNGAAPIIIANLITDNESDDTGGGIQCYTASPMIKGNIITGNISGRHGGGINSWLDAAPTIIGNVIAHNTSYSYMGGGIGAGRSTIHIEGNIITNNVAFNNGGGILCRITTATIIGNTIVGNQAYNLGGAITCQDNASVVLLHNVLWGDSAGTYDEIYVDSTSTVTVRYSDVEGGWPGEGNIDLQPLFRNLPVDDYHLMSIACGDPQDSPCIDAGHPDSLDTFLDCEHGLGTQRCDIGAYGGLGGPPVSINEPDKSETLQLPRISGLFQNYPNPFNPTTIISFDVAGISQVTKRVELTIYNIRGQKVTILLDSELEPGNHKIMWNGRDDKGEQVSSGIYFYTLRSDDYISTRKMLLLK